MARHLTIFERSLLASNHSELTPPTHTNKTKSSTLRGKLYKDFFTVQMSHTRFHVTTRKGNFTYARKTGAAAPVPNYTDLALLNSIMCRRLIPRVPNPRPARLCYAARARICHLYVSSRSLSYPQPLPASSPQSAI